jgi:glycosyltransferase involved in cell wall biosynthesis
MRLAIVSTHPIQYYAPLFRFLTNKQDMVLKVFYTWSQAQSGAKYDQDFGKMIEWDIPLLDGYSYEFVDNTAKDPGVHHFNGISHANLNSEIEKWEPEALLVIGWNFRSHLACMRYFKGKTPVLFKGDSTLLDEKPGLKKMLRRIFLSWVYSKVDLALYVGRNNYAYFRKHGMHDDQLLWVPHAVDNARFSHGSEHGIEISEWRKKLDIQNEDLVVLFAGKLEPKKDPDFILRLAKNISDARLKLIIVGNGILETELKEKASGDKRITFLDFQNQQKMPLVYRLCDIFVLPSKGPGETWGLAVNEAMACKRPAIVSTKCGCAPDLIEENVTGWVFEPGDKGDSFVKDLLIRILDDRSNISSMGEKAWEKLQPFSYKTIGEKIMSINLS